MYLTDLLFCVSLCITFVEINSKCATTFITTCESVKEIASYGKKSWKNLIIAKDVCKIASISTDETLNANTFRVTPALEELYIYGKLVKIDSGAFNGLEQLTYLKLHKNFIKVIPQGAFSNLSQVLKLDLQDNLIENIAHGLFENASITSINLSYNKLNNLQVNQLNIPSLQKLTITNNDIYFLAPNCFHKNLEYLNLDHNSISDIEDGVLVNLENLKVLILSNNKIKGIALNFGLPGLQKLDLTYNEIVGVQDNAFKDFYELRTLLLGHNYIRFLSHSAFPVGNVISILHLHNNTMINLDLQLGAKLANLKEITLSANPWACPCFDSISAYLAVKKIGQPDCDKDYFRKGFLPICISTGNVCSGGEMLVQETYSDFKAHINYVYCDV